MVQRKTNVSEENRKRSDAIGSLESLLSNMLGLATFASVFICSFATFTFKPWEFQIRYFGNHPYAIFFILLCFGLGMWQVFKSLKKKESLLKKYQWSVSDYLALGLGLYCVQYFASVIIVWTRFVWGKSFIGTDYDLVPAFLLAFVCYYVLKQYAGKHLNKICPLQVGNNDTNSFDQASVAQKDVAQSSHSKSSKCDTLNTLTLERVPLNHKAQQSESKWRMLLPVWSQRLFDQTENALGIVFFVGMVIWGAVLLYHYIGALDWWLDFRSATTRFLGTTAIVALTLFLARLVIYFVPIFIFFYLRDGLYWTWYQALSLVAAPLVASIPWYVIIGGMEWLRHSGVSSKKTSSTPEPDFVRSKDKTTDSCSTSVQSAKVSVGEESLSKTSSESFVSAQMEKGERSSLGQGQTDANEKDSFWGSLAGIALLTLIVVGMVAVAVKSTNSVSSPTVSAVRPVVQKVNLPPEPQLFVPSTWTQDFLKKSLVPYLSESMNEVLSTESSVRQLGLPYEKIALLKNHYREVFILPGIEKALGEAVWKKKSLFDDQDDAKVLKQQLFQVVIGELNRIQQRGLSRLPQQDLKQITLFIVKIIRNTGSENCAAYYRGSPKISLEDQSIRTFKNFSSKDLEYFYELCRTAINLGVNGQPYVPTMTPLQMQAVFDRLAKRATYSRHPTERRKLINGFNEVYDQTPFKNPDYTCRSWSNLLTEATKLTGADAEFLRDFFAPIQQ